MEPTNATLLSRIQQFTTHNVLQSPASHPFAASSRDSMLALHGVIQATNQLSHSLNLYSSMALTNPKLHSLLRQQVTIQHNLHLSDQNIRQTVDALRSRSGTSYGENVPLDRSALMDWIVSRLESWGTSVGMETFKDDLMRDGEWTVVLGGKLLVLDIDFSSGPTSDVKGPRIEVDRLKTSYAVPNAAIDGSITANTEGSTSLDELLAGSIRAFLHEVQKDPEVQDALEAERLGMVIVGHLKYLMMLDRLAARKEAAGGGIRWFVDVDELGVGVEKFAQSEADAVAASLSLSHAPLDIYLQRSHGLPLPYLISPALNFLIYLSPLLYLSILRSTPPPPVPLLPNSHLPKLDVPLVHLRGCLSAHPFPKGATIATLTLAKYPTPEQGLPPSIEVDDDGTRRPAFPLAEPESNHILPQLSVPSQDALSADDHFTWVLDFTSSGQCSGIVMSQSRMREIECVLDPSSVGGMDSVEMMGFGGGQGLRSWVDLLVNPAKSFSHSAPSSERYTALYRSPSSAYPPLQLRLTTPDEPGFVLERVRVKSIKEVWGILEIAREQCWLNESLNSIDWAPESSTKDVSVVNGTVENLATEDMLQALMEGTHPPTRIPVEVYLPTPMDTTFSTVDLSFDVPAASTTPIRQPPKITMSLPERPPISGFVDVVVSYDLSRPKGVKVEVGGPMGMGIDESGVDVEKLEEVCRRGGLFGLAGRIWKATSAG